MSIAVIGIALLIILIFGGIISAKSRNMKIMKLTELLIAASVVGLTWVVWRGGNPMLIVGIALGAAMEFMTMKKIANLQILQMLQNSE